MCATCTQAGSCTGCNSATGYPLSYGTSCYQACPAATFPSSSTTCQGNFFQNFSLINPVSLDCQAYCTSCTSASNCFACQNLKYLYQDSCIDDCPSGTYADIYSVCQCIVVNGIFIITSIYLACESPCVNCISASQCVSCISGLLWYNYQCFESCPDGTWTNSAVCTSKF